MASTIQDKLYETFAAVSGQQDSNPAGALDNGEEIAASLSDTVKQIGQLPASGDAQAASSGSSTSTTRAAASGSTSTAGTTSGESTADSISKIAMESQAGLIPLILGLLHVFGGGGTPAAPTLEKYAMPDHLYFEGADTGSGGVPSGPGGDYDQMGMPRAYSAAPNAASPQASGPATPGSSGANTASGAPAPQITVNVHAMDSQSFLDHSSEIAQAVRTAMLNSNSINDVVNDL